MTTMKNWVRHTLTVGAALLVLVAALGASLNEAQRKRIDEATTVLRELRSAPDKSIPQDLWEKASCVAVIPAVKKAAFIVGPATSSKAPTSARRRTPSISWPC